MLRLQWVIIAMTTISFCGDRNVMELDSVMVAKLHEYMKSHQIVPFKRVNFTICELYLNKAIIIFFNTRWFALISSVTFVFFQPILYLCCHNLYSSQDSRSLLPRSPKYKFFLIWTVDEDAGGGGNSFGKGSEDGV